MNTNNISSFKALALASIMCKIDVERSIVLYDQYDNIAGYQADYGNAAMKENKQSMFMSARVDGWFDKHHDMTGEEYKEQEGLSAFNEELANMINHYQGRKGNVGDMDMPGFGSKIVSLINNNSHE